MHRRSNRLVQSGYYSNEEDGDRNLSYHEALPVRIFKKRMGPKRPRYFNESSSGAPFYMRKPVDADEPSGPYYNYTDDRKPAVTTSNLHKILAMIGLLFGLTLAFGFYCYSSTFPNVSSRTETSWAPLEIKAIKDEVFHVVTQKETPWEETWTRDWGGARREIALLKAEILNQEHIIETLKNDISDFKTTMNTENLDRVFFEQQFAGAEKQLSELKAELSLWLNRLRTLISRSQGSVVHRVELQRALADLEKRMTDLFSVQSSKTREELKRRNMGALTTQDVDETVQRALRLFRADGIGMADFALESLGSTVIHSRCSNSYLTRSLHLKLFGIPLLNCGTSPRTIIQPEVYPGKCWAFEGDQGFATIALVHPVYITHVTLEHLPKVLSPSGHINNAPKEFSVYGMSQPDEEGKLLGSFLYGSDGEPIQTFELPESARDVYSTIQLRVMSNWGHPNYTCIYRFRVHGELRTP